MKKFTIVNLLIAFVFILGACGTSNNVVNNHLISKRKYTKGFHINKRSNLKSTKGTQEEEVLAFDTKEEQKKTAVNTTVKSVQQTNTNASMATKLNPEVSEAIAPKSKAVASKTKDVKSESNNQASVEKTATKPAKKTLPSRKGLVPMKKESENNSGSGWADSMFILAVICAILIPPLGVGIYTNIDWTKVLICLLLTILFWLPGMIYALLVVFDVI